MEFKMSDFKTLTTKKKLPGYKRTKYVRISDTKQDGVYQSDLLDDHYPGIKHLVIDTCPGDKPFHKRELFSSILQNRLVFCWHPDRIFKSQIILDIEDFISDLIENGIIINFLNIRAIVKSYLSFQNNPSEEAYMDLIVDRFKSMNPNKVKSYRLKKDEIEIVIACYRKFLKPNYKSEGWSLDLRFWMVSSYLGKTINLIFEYRNKKARDLADNTFGTKPEQIRFYYALKDIESDYWFTGCADTDNEKDLTTLTHKELSALLKKNREIVNQNGDLHKESKLSVRINSKQYKRYQKLDDIDLLPITDFLQGPEPVFNYKTVVPSEPQFRKALRKFKYSSLYRDQYNVLLKLNLRTNVIYSTRTGGGKNDIPIHYAYLNPDHFIVVVAPLKALIDDYYSSLVKHFKPSEIGLFHGGHDNQFNKYIRSINNYTMRFAVVTPDALQKKTDTRLIDALIGRGVGLVVLDECHHLLVSGKVDFRKVYKSTAIRKVLKQLGNPLTLFMSATINNLVYEEIGKVLIHQKYKIVKGDLNRPNLKLFTLIFDNKGQKFTALFKLIKTMRRYERRKGIIFFSSVSSLLRAEKILNELRIKTLIHFGKDHPKLSAKQKVDNLKAFRKSRNIIMLTTASFGEGINIPNIDFSILFEHPGSIIECLQWAGRAGRNGKLAPVILMDDPNGIKIRQSLIDSNTSPKGKKVQQKLFNNYVDIFKRFPQPSFKNLISELSRE